MSDTNHEASVLDHYSEVSEDTSAEGNSAAKKTANRAKPTMAGKVLAGAISWVRGRLDKQAAPGLVFAGFWYRLLAFLMDFTLSLALSLAAVTVIQLTIPAAFLHLDKIGGNTIALMLLQFSYFWIFECSAWKATPAKRFLKLRVTDSRGQRLGIVSAATRTLLKLTVPFSFGAAILWMFFSKKHQTLYDKLTGALVLRKSNESFLPIALRKWHKPIVIGLSMLIFAFTLRSMIMLVTPRFEGIRLVMIVSQSIKDLEPAQKSIEESLLKDGKLPQRLDLKLFPHTTLVNYVYQPANGSLALVFNMDKLKGMGLILSPSVGAKKDVVWSCAGLNMPPEMAPSMCAATTATAKPLTRF